MTTWWWWTPPDQQVPDGPPVDITGLCDDECAFARTPVGACVEECAYQTFGQRIEVER